MEYSMSVLNMFSRSIPTEKGYIKAHENTIHLPYQRQSYISKHLYSIPTRLQMVSKYDS